MASGEPFLSWKKGEEMLTAVASDVGLFSAQDLTKLKGAGFATVLGVIQATRKTLTKIKVSPQVFITGAECAIRREKVIAITTGSKSFDAMLGGGIMTQSMTEGGSRLLPSCLESTLRFDLLSKVYGEFR
ncbi:hypothetical protein P7C70_g3974, partial [Phenoliferia sp. Uapishka_3]